MTGSGRAEKSGSGSGAENQLLMISLVVGAHPVAEEHERPIVNELRRALERAISAAGSDLTGVRVQTVTDLWFLADASLASAPCIAVGCAQTNAAVAHFSSRIPQALVVDGAFEILIDQAGGDDRVCIRGVDTESTRRGVAEFQLRFMGSWLKSIGASRPG